MQFQTLTKKVVGCKVLQFIHTIKIKKMLGHKTLRCKYTTLIQEKEMNQGKNFVFGHNLLEESLLIAYAICELFDRP